MAFAFIEIFNCIKILEKLRIEKKVKILFLERFKNA